MKRIALVCAGVLAFLSFNLSAKASDMISISTFNSDATSGVSGTYLSAVDLQTTLPYTPTYVNGETFTGSGQSGTVSGITYADSSQAGFEDSSVPANAQGLAKLNSQGIYNSYTTESLTLTGLPVGMPLEIRLFSFNADTYGPDTQNISLTNGSTVTANYNGYDSYSYPMSTINAFVTSITGSVTITITPSMPEVNNLPTTGFTVQAVPEPCSLGFVSLSALGLLRRRSRRHNA